MAHWHHVDAIPGDKHPRLFKTLWKWFRNVPEKFANTTAQAKFESNLSINNLQRKLERLEAAVQKLNCPIVFCHNDLLSGNIIICPEQGDVAFIDYEYGAFNYRSFDVANHFCEYSGFECDYSKYPSKEFQRSWIRIYLLEWARLSGLSQVEPSADEVEAMLHEVAIFTLAAHCFWGLWGLTQAQHSDIDFDYMNYACCRFAEYDRRSDVLDD